MDTEKSGAALHGEDEAARSEAARMMGRARTERKAQAARLNGAKNTFTDETRAKLREAQAARRERERQERAAAGIVEVVKEPKKPGRPAKIKPDVEAQPKRPRGRPKKQNEQMTAQELDTPETGVEGQKTV